jgi:hypothetical protein
MSKVQFITRADDIGSSHSSNLAAAKVAKAGLIKNFSLMAPGAYIEEAAQMFAASKDMCFGMHTTLNAEWDKVKWKPILPLEQSSGLVDENGYFLANPPMFANTKPSVDTVISEVNAQFERLHKLGFDIKYIDSHMMAELFIDGMDEAIEEFAKKKGILDHMYYYNLPPGIEEFIKNPSKPLKYLKSIPPGQYFIVIHPSLDTEEMRQTGNASTSGIEIAKARANETKLFSGFLIKSVIAGTGCSAIRYDEAITNKRAHIDEVREIYLKYATEDRRANSNDLF